MGNRSSRENDRSAAYSKDSTSHFHRRQAEDAAAMLSGAGATTTLVTHNQHQRHYAGSTHSVVLSVVVGSDVLLYKTAVLCSNRSNSTASLRFSKLFLFQVLHR